MVRGLKPFVAMPIEVTQDGVVDDAAGCGREVFALQEALADMGLNTTTLRMLVAAYMRSKPC
jgi:hypothetical protein